MTQAESLRAALLRIYDETLTEGITPRLDIREIARDALAATPPAEGHPDVFVAGYKAGVRASEAGRTAAPAERDAGRAESKGDSSATPPTEGLDVDVLARALEKVYDAGRVQCRCGKWPLLENWSDHRLRKDGRPHRWIRSDSATLLAREYAALRAAATHEEDGTHEGPHFTGEFDTVARSQTCPACATPLPANKARYSRDIPLDAPWSDANGDEIERGVPG